MTIILCGGGSGGHITPLLAVAKELKKQNPDLKLIGLCEKKSRFAHLLKDSSLIDEVYQVRAGKLRRYAGRSWLSRLVDFRTLFFNVRDSLYVLRGYSQSRRLLKRLKPDGIFIKGGFVGAPVGIAARRLHIPFITHDSDSVPGLANRIIARWALLHATGMPAEYYTYPKDRTVFTGTPVSADFKQVDDQLRQSYREGLGLQDCKTVIAIIGGSQGAGQLNEAMIAIIGRLMQQSEGLGVLHIVGETHKETMLKAYKAELLADELERVVVEGFVDDVYRYTGAADLVVTRAGANAMAELAIQGVSCILVPGLLAGGHQEKNAQHFVKNNQARVVTDGDSEGLLKVIKELLENTSERQQLAGNLHSIGKPKAAEELATLLISNFSKEGNSAP